MKKKQKFKQKSFRFKRFERKSYSAFNSMHKAVTIGVLSLLTVSISNVSKTSAQSIDSNQFTSIKEHQLEQVEIKDSSLQTPINQVARIVTTITQKEIERLQPQSIQDLLTYVASVDVQTRGSHGVQSDISIRGGTFDQTAILLNGINISNPQTGHYSFDIPINLSDIERIEIINGPSAIIYGSSAFSGGINIITKKGVDKNLNVNLEAGQHQLFSSQISGAYKIKNVENYLSLGYKTTEGYIKNSDYDMMNILYQSRINMKNNKLDIQLGYNNKSYGANTFYSAAYPNQHDSVASYLASIKGSFGSKFKFLPTIYWNRHDDKFQLDKDNSKYDNYHQSNVIGSDMNFQYSSILGTTNFGFQARYEAIESSVLGKPMAQTHDKFTKQDNRMNYCAFVQQNYSYKRFFFSVGLLTFENSAIKQDFHLYPAINVNYNFANNSDLYLSYNNSSRLPTFTDLYYTTKTNISNANLKQEESSCIEMGIKNKNRYVVSYVSVYYMKGKNMIDWVKKNVDDKWESMNITSLNKYGVEFNGKFFIHELIDFMPFESNISLNYSYMYQEKVDDGYISNYALNYLKHKFTARLFTPLYKDKFSCSINFRMQKRMGQYLEYVSNKPTTKKDYPFFTTTDVTFNYNYKKMKLYLNLNNIFNEEYFDLGNVAQPKFWLIGGLTLSI